MFDAFIGGLLINLQLKPFIYMLIGSAIGFWVGILPGLGGGATLALMMPFIYNMTPEEALPFLLGMHSVVATTGDITSVLKHSGQSLHSYLYDEYGLLYDNYFGASS